MLAYLLRRLASAIPVLILLSLAIFVLIRALPGDPALLYAGPEATAEELDDLRERMGLEDPWPAQYLRFIGHALQGDLGTSLRSGRPVLAELKERLPVTGQLAFFTMICSILIGVTLGMLAVIYPRTSTPLYLLSLVGISTPVYWLGLILILLFSLRLDWFPPAGGMGWQSLILPVMAMGASTTASLFRLTLGGYREVTSQEYMQVAKAKGLGPVRLHLKHGLRNALIPIITFVGLEFANLLGGAVLTESVFSLNGIGRFLVTSVAQRDYPVVQGAILLLCSVFIIINLVVDLIYFWIDPRMGQR